MKLLLSFITAICINFSGTAHATDYARITELDAELRAVIGEREAAEEAWLALADEQD